MKINIVLLALLVSGTTLFAQTDRDMVENTCTLYIEGFYEGDEEKLKTCLATDLKKFGFWKNKDNGEYGEPLRMTYEEALAYARRVKEKGKFAPADAPKEVWVLDVMDKIACAKVAGSWGWDYMLLSKNEGAWKIDQVIWQGPYTKE